LITEIIITPFWDTNPEQGNKTNAGGDIEISSCNEQSNDTTRKSKGHIKQNKQHIPDLSKQHKKNNKNNPNTNWNNN
jgi:hypothetical protein